jgi:hypothetical protein
VNLFLLAKRGQTLGQYVVGLTIVSESSGPVGAIHSLLYLLAFHPLLFHPIIAGFWGLFGYVGFTLGDSRLTFMVGVALALLCFVSPLVSFFFAVTDSYRRGLHDRIAGVRLVRVE